MNYDIFIDPKFLISAISIIVGTFVAYNTYKVTKQKKDFDQANHIRSLLREYLNLENEISNKVMPISNALREKTAIEEFSNIKSTGRLLHTIGLNKLTSSDAEVKKLIREAQELHTQFIEPRNLYLFTLQDLAKKHHKALGNYEKTLIYKRVLLNKLNHENWYTQILKFYKSLKKQQDYSNQMRMGFSLVDSEIKNNLLIEAKEHIKEISDPETIKNSAIDPQIIKLKISQLSLALQQLNNEVDEDIEVQLMER